MESIFYGGKASFFRAKNLSRDQTSVLLSVLLLCPWASQQVSHFWIPKEPDYLRDWPHKGFLQQTSAWFVTIMNCPAGNIGFALPFWVAKTQAFNTTPLLHIIFLQCSPCLTCVKTDLYILHYSADILANLKHFRNLTKARGVVLFWNKQGFL